MTKTVNDLRRKFVKTSASLGLIAAFPTLKAATTTPPGRSFGTGSLHVLSDGHLRIPLSFPGEDASKSEEIQKLIADNSLNMDPYEPPCNITLWQADNRLVLFDVGSGSQFMDTAGLLPLQLEEMEVDPADITDVVFTHAHPDHCWGLLDDFDELLCPNATYHIHGIEFDYWMSEDTLTQAPESRLGMVAGARNRLPLIEPQLNRFTWGDEIIPGIEAVDTHGHTPGHTSFAIHQNSGSLLVLGDAITHEIFSFQRPQWPWASDQNSDAAISTRMSLLDRMAAEQTLFVAFHLAYPGFGRAEKFGDSFRFVADSG